MTRLEHRFQVMKEEFCGSAAQRPAQNCCRAWGALAVRREKNYRFLFSVPLIAGDLGGDGLSLFPGAPHGFDLSAELSHHCARRNPHARNLEAKLLVKVRTCFHDHRASQHLHHSVSWNDTAINIHYVARAQPTKQRDRYSVRQQFCFGQECAAAAWRHSPTGSSDNDELAWGAVRQGTEKRNSYIPGGKCQGTSNKWILNCQSFNCRIFWEHAANFDPGSRSLPIAPGEDDELARRAVHPGTEKRNRYFPPLQRHGSSNKSIDTVLAPATDVAGCLR